MTQNVQSWEEGEKLATGKMRESVTCNLIDKHYLTLGLLKMHMKVLSIKMIELDKLCPTFQK